jgi:TolA-binding protein
VLANAPDEATKVEAWMGLGRSLWRQGLRDEAREVYLQAAESITNPDAAATALWWAAVLAGQDNEKWLQAADDFMRLAREFPDSDYADQAGFRAGLIHYRLGDYETARELWTEHSATGDGTWRAAAHFWLGKLLQQEGKEQEALAHWQETAQRWDEQEFYGVRARQELQKAGIAPTPTPVPDSAGDLQEAKAWAAAMAGQDVAVFDQTPPEFERIEALHRVGEETQAHRELEEELQRRNLQITALKSKLEFQSRQLAEARQERQSVEEKYLVLAGDYDRLKVKYDKLIKPARSAKGRHLVEVRYYKRKGKHHIEWREGDSGEFEAVSRSKLDGILTRLKKEHREGLYIRVILPQESGLSYSEAWKFTNDLHRRYDYYYQETSPVEKAQSGQ